MMAGDANILQMIAARTRERVAAEKAAHPLAEVAAKARAKASHGSDFPFEAALRAPGRSFICECKKASPS